MDTIAFLGLGAMGERMAHRLLDAGSQLVVWNRTAGRTKALVAAGASAATTPAEAAREADVVLTMLANPDALREVAEGPDGVGHGVRAGATVIEMSTVGPDSIARLRSSLPEQVFLLDAPVLGSLAEAETGTLRIFVGGDTDLVDRWSPILSNLGTPLHVGPLGAGAAAKLVANATLVGTLTLLGEAMAVGEGMGLSGEQIFEVLAATPLATQAERRRQAIEQREFPRRFALSLAHKDAELLRAAAEKAGLSLPVLAAAGAWFADADARGLGDADYTAILGWILDHRSGGRAGL